AIDSGLATGDYLVFGDDDDAFFPDTRKAIVAAARIDPGRPLMFRMIDPNGAIVWVDEKIRMGNHGTPMFVVPNDPKKRGRFGNRYEGDFDFVQSTLAKYTNNDYTGESMVVWDKTIIYGCRIFGDAMQVRALEVEGA